MNRLLPTLTSLALLAGGAALAPAHADAGAPRGVHTSFVDDPTTTLAIVWFTDGATDPHARVEYAVKHGASCDAVTLSRSAASLAPVLAPGVSVTISEVLLTGLEPDTTYCYRATGDTGSSPTFEVSTLPAAGPITMTLFSDHGRSAASNANVQRLIETDPDLHLIAGDISYANGNQPIWDAYFDQIQPYAAQIPTMAALGNHEVEDNFGTQAFRSRFAFPGRELFYSLDVGRAHIVVISGGAALDETTPDEFAFLDADLAQAAARRAAGELDFIIAMQHFPIWSNHDGRGPCDAALVAVEEQYLQRYGVDVFLTGHNHHYERSKPMIYGQPTTDEVTSYGPDRLGMIQVISGGGGQSLYNFVAPDDFQDWSAAYAKRFHYTTLELDTGILTVTARATDTNEILDRFELTGPRTLAAPTSSGMTGLCR